MCSFNLHHEAIENQISNFSKVAYTSVTRNNASRLQDTNRRDLETSRDVVLDFEGTLAAEADATLHASGEVIPGSSPSDLIIVGAGTVELSGNNSHDITFVNPGATLRVSGAENLGAADSLLFLDQGTLEIADSLSCMRKDALYPRHILNLISANLRKLQKVAPCCF